MLCLIILLRIVTMWDNVVKLVGILEVIKRYTSLSQQFELEKNELLSERRWTLLQERGEPDHGETWIKLCQTLHGLGRKPSK